MKKQEEKLKFKTLEKGDKFLIQQRNNLLQQGFHPNAHHTLARARVSMVIKYHDGWQKGH